MWELSSFLPPLLRENVVTNGEGMTPLKSSKVSPETVYLKDESKNPTGSFKDRPTSVCVSMAKEFGCTKIVTASSGNGAAAAACYASLAGMDNTIFVPEHTPMAKVAQTLAYGGNVVKVRGNFSRSYELAKLAAQSPEVMNVTTTFLNPYGVEGDKTIAHEIYKDLGTNPTAVFLPVGAGPIAYGIFKGFKELCHIHTDLSMPRIIAVQAAGCAPIANALLLGTSVCSEKHPATIASAISDPLDGYEQDGELTVRAIQATQGFGITVTDAEIVNAGLELARLEGLFVEPASAAAYAGYRKAVNETLIDASDLIVCILTGHGLKDSGAYIGNASPIPMIEHLSDMKTEREGNLSC
jgi:threonine synthase